MTASENFQPLPLAFLCKGGAIISSVQPIRLRVAVRGDKGPNTKATIR